MRNRRRNGMPHNQENCWRSSIAPVASKRDIANSIAGRCNSLRFWYMNSVDTTVKLIDDRRNECNRTHDSRKNFFSGGLTSFFKFLAPRNLLHLSAIFSLSKCRGERVWANSFLIIRIISISSLNVPVKIPKAEHTFILEIETW
jgi:hypothetical protein